MTRRRFVVSASLAPLLPYLRTPVAWAAPADQPLRALSEHDGAVVVAATARLIPGPTDDPLEVGSPGAREAGVVHYIDALLGAFDGADDGTPPPIYAGGPFSDRAGGDRNHLADFLPLTPLQDRYWRAAVADLRQQYAAGIAALDAAAGGDFAAAPAALQDQVLTADATGFRDLLFGHAIEGWLANPEYGGNAGGTGWQAVSFPGDSIPDGYTADEVSTSDGPDPIDPTGVVATAIAVVGGFLGA